MSFLSTVKVPGGGTPTNAGADETRIPDAKSTFLKGISLGGAPKVQAMQQEVDTQVSAANSRYANSFTGIAKNTLEGLTAPFIEGWRSAAAVAPPKTLNPKAASDLVLQTFGDAVQHAGDKIYESTQILKDSHAGLLKKGVSVGEAALATTAPFFAALTAPLTYASSLPGVGHVADKVNELFSAIGSGAGSYASTALVDTLPVSDETKATIRPLVHDVASFAAQLYAGKAGGDAFGKLTEKSRDIMGAVSSEVKTNPVHGEALKEAVSRETLTEEAKKYKTADEFIASRGEPLYHRTNQEFENFDLNKKREISTGIHFESSKARSDASGSVERFGNRQIEAYTDTKIADITPQFEANQSDFSYKNLPKELQEAVQLKGEARVAKLKELGYGGYKSGTEVSIFNPKDIKTRAQLEELYTQANKGAPEVIPSADSQGTFLSEVRVPTPDGGFKYLGEGEKGVSRLSANVEANAIERGLTNAFGELPEYNRINMADQATAAMKLIQEDPARGMRIALGQELPPGHILPESVFTAVERAAVERGDAAALKRLATESNLSTQATEMGQRIRALGERDQESPVKLIQDVADARAKGAEKQSGKTVSQTKRAEVKAIKDSIKENSSKRPTWEEFMNELTCNI